MACRVSYSACSCCSRAVTSLNCGVAKSELMKVNAKVPRASGSSASMATATFSTSDAALPLSWNARAALFARLRIGLESVFEKLENAR